MRPIDADEIKKRIARITCVGGWSKGILMQFVNEEPTIEIPSWIPCSERLPEEEKDVLVSVHFLGLNQKHKNGWNDHIKENWYVDIASHVDGDWTSYSDEYKVAKSRHIIIAWMPLPEPWKGADDE